MLIELPERYPEHLAEVLLPMEVAARLVGCNSEGLVRAILRGRLRARPFPQSERRVHWQVKVRDLAEYTKRPFRPEWIAVIEAAISWEPGREVRRVG